MIVSFTRQFVFIAVPRTGSTAIFHALKPFGAAVIPYRKAESPCYQQDIDGFHDPHVPSILETFFVFAGVRNPYTRMVSHYRMAANDPLHRLHKAVTDFPAFVDLVILGKLLVPQVEFLGNVNAGGFVCLERDLGEQLRALPPFEGAVVTVGAINRSDYDRPWYAYYDERTVGVVAEWGNQDFERFGYSTDFVAAIDGVIPTTLQGKAQ